MNRFRGIVAPEQLVKGDIIQFKTQGTAMERRNQPLSYGYIHHIEYDARKNDEIVSLRVLPVVRAENAQGTDFRYRVINQENVGTSLGLDPNRIWAILLAPLRLEPTEEYLGKRDGVVQRMGNIAATAEQEQLLELIDNTGGDDRLYYGQSGAPRMARPSESAWGLYAPIGIKKDRFEESEYTIVDKRKYRRKADFEGQVIDIDLDKAVQVLGIGADVAKMFSSPADKRVKKFTTLRGLNDLLSGDAETVERYVPKESGLTENVTLLALQGTEITWGVVSGLAEPRKGASVKPVLDLQAAYELVTQRPQDIAQYMFMGPKLTQYAINDITAAYNGRAVQSTPEERIAEITSTVKAAWKDLMQGYMEFRQTQAVPEKFRDEDDKPVWKMVPKAP